MSIISFKDRDLIIFFTKGIVPKKSSWHNLAKVALRKLDMLNCAVNLKDLNTPGNKLKALKGDMYQFYSIRINDQWRIIFKWTKKGPEEVEIIDYHF